MADLLPSIDSDEEFKPPEDVPEDEDERVCLLSADQDLGPGSPVPHQQHDGEGDRVSFHCSLKFSWEGELGNRDALAFAREQNSES